jgi:ATP-dependent helicase HrpA
LETHHQVLLALVVATSPRCDAAVRDMRDQLADLTAEGYLVETPWTWLVHYPRYFQAILIRLDKLKSSGYGRDAEAIHELQPLLDAYRQRRKEHEERGIFDPELEQFRWMLEELRVSLFAQQLGTVLRVSPTRLKKHWPKVRV